MTISVDAIEDPNTPRLTEAQITAAMPALKASVLNTSGEHSLDARFRALFTLKSIGSSEAISTLALAFTDSSALFKHEAAYILGQIGNPEAIDALEAGELWPNIYETAPDNPKRQLRVNNTYEDYL